MTRFNRVPKIFIESLLTRQPNPKHTSKIMLDISQYSVVKHHWLRAAFHRIANPPLRGTTTRSAGLISYSCSMPQTEMKSYTHQKPYYLSCYGSGQSVNEVSHRRERILRESGIKTIHLAILTHDLNRGICGNLDPVAGGTGHVPLR